MSRVDRNILRIAIYEILHRKDVPPKVSIDEAVDLGKRYGTEESSAFINGILDHIYNQLKAEGVVDQRG
jgi:N utilization substance protein B